MQFSQVIGQEEIKERLRHAFREGRIAHALMFLGPEGSGNLALALAFAQYISCKNRNESDSCGVCSACKKISDLQFADMYFTFPYFNKTDSIEEKTTCNDWIKEWRAHLANSAYTTIEQWRNDLTNDNKHLNISVGEASNVIHHLALKSFDGGFKFQIIWMAEYLKPETANKLLKIIEEPPSNTIFMMVANSMENILPTILSRVQTIYIPKIDDNDITQSLMQLGTTQETAKQIAHFAHGDWNKALMLLHSKNPDEQYANQFQFWMRMCYRKDVPGIIKWADEMHKLSREEQKSFLGYALDQVRQNLVMNYAGEDFVRLNSGEKMFADKFAPYINDLNAEELMEELTESHRDISRNVYSKLVFTDMSFRLHYQLTRKA
jgi:DNA polymerase-3 subunit delta'